MHGAYCLGKRGDIGGAFLLFFNFAWSPIGNRANCLDNVSFFKFFRIAHSGIHPVFGFEKYSADGRAHPPGVTRSGWLETVLSEPIELGRGPEPRPHQLHLIHDPEAVVVEKGEVHGPAGAGHAVSAVECAGEEHVLCADEDSGLFRIDVPFAAAVIIILSAHEDDGGALGEPFEVGVFRKGEREFLKPGVDFVARLFHKRSHGQAVDEAARPFFIA
ncbi:MAG: hypothetical protein BWY59_02406 [Verrucomicrobia bacterium ADurb.Bin345]|nr:MAG: hypothetical protein BWY59_02406 [Verrucomicrobia bacterium ADurb.Bin345]